MPFDVSRLRDQFPSLCSGLAHFDGPGGTQTPAAVGQAIADTLTAPLANRGRTNPAERNAEAVVAAFRSAYADLLGVPETGIVYGRSATQLTYDFSRHLSGNWGPGDEIVVSRLDHDANVRPWMQAAERAGASLRWLEFDPATGELPLDQLATVITERTRLVAVTAASNLLGTKPTVRHIADAAHRVGAWVYVDGVHYTAHSTVDVPSLGADFFVCSPYKFLGPHCAVLAAEAAVLETIHPDKLAPSPNAVPERFEFGTLPYEILAGATAAVDFLADIAPGEAQSRRDRLQASHHAIEAHEDALHQQLTNGIAELGDRVTVHSQAAEHTPTTYLSFPGHRSADAAEFLAERNILAPAGSFYAYEAAGALSLDRAPGLRIGMAVYNTCDEVDRLLTALKEFAVDED